MDLICSSRCCRNFNCCWNILVIAEIISMRSTCITKPVANGLVQNQTKEHGDNLIIKHCFWICSTHMHKYMWQFSKLTNYIKSQVYRGVHCGKNYAFTYIFIFLCQKRQLFQEHRYVTKSMLSYITHTIKFVKPRKNTV